eukprot:698800-Hanusia_phi.AAC.2
MRRTGRGGERKREERRGEETRREEGRGNEKRGADEREKIEKNILLLHLSSFHLLCQSGDPYADDWRERCKSKRAGYLLVRLLCSRSLPLLGRLLCSRRTIKP